MLFIKMNVIILLSNLLFFACMGNVKSEETNGIPFDKLAAYWSMDIADISAETLRSEGKYVNTSVDENGKLNQSIHFNGQSSYVDFGDILDDIFVGPDKKITITMWVKPSRNHKYGNLIAKHGDTSCDNTQNQRQFGVQIRSNSSANLPNFYYMTPSGKQLAMVQSDKTIQNNIWSHLAITYNGEIDTSPKDRVNIYVNGLKTNISSTLNRGVFPFDLQDSSAHFSLGEQIDGNGQPCQRKSKNNFEGSLDEVAIWDEVLTYNQIEKIRQQEISGKSVLHKTDDTIVIKESSDGLKAYYPFNGNANDESGNGYNGRVSNAVLTTDRFGKNNSAYEFDGRSSLIEIFTGGELIATDTITVTAWIYPTAATLSKKGQSTIFVQNDVGAGRVTHQIRLRAEKLEYDNWNPWNGWTSSQANIVANQWNHIAAVRKGNDIKLYINGLLNSSGVGEPRIDARNIDNVFIGARYYRKSPKDAFQGKLDEIRIYNTALPGQKIKELYSETVATKLPQADLANEPCCDLNGEFRYSGNGIATVKQSGSDILIYLTWIPKGKGPHYEIKGTLLGNIITGKWFSHYDNKGWFDFNGIVSPSGKIIDFSKTYDPLGSAINNIVIFNKSLLTDPDISVIEAGSVDGYMSNQEVQLRSKLEGTGIIVSREKKHIILKLPNNITFDTDSDLLKPRFTPILKSIVSVLKEYNSTLVTTIGHTDNVGADEYNQTLSEKRAKSLSNYLSNNGVNEKRLTSIGKGRFQPVSSNDTNSGRAMNRRVEIMLEPLHK